MTKPVTNILKAIVATLLYIIGIELIGSWFYIAEVLEFENYNDYYFLIQGALQFGAVLVFMYFVRSLTLKSLITKTNFKWYVIALFLGLSFVFLQTPLKWVYNLLFETEYQIAYRFDGLEKFKNVNMLSFVLLIPISEELVFRKYIQNSLQKRTNWTFAILFASILFALIHSPYMNLLLESSNQDWHLFYLTIFGGIISGTLYYKSKSVGPSIVYHIFWNIMVYIV